MVKLDIQDKDYIMRVYRESETREQAQMELADHFGVTTRTIRNWARELNIGSLAENMTDPRKVLIYDIETSRGIFKGWWTGKQYVGYRQIVKEPAIITIAWKWLGDDSVQWLTWDKNQSDREMVESFLKVYNSANMVIGYNNDNFDNRWLNAQAFKYGLEVNTHVRSLDLMKQEKRLFRMISYSMDYTSLVAGVERKQSHEGIRMWDMIEDGTPEEQQEYLQKMLDYNIGDIVTTEELYLRLVPYLRHKMHFGVYFGGPKWTCPNTGREDVRLLKRTVTPAGTVQNIMQSPDGSTYKISNKSYMDFLNHQTIN